MKNNSSSKSKAEPSKSDAQATTSRSKRLLTKLFNFRAWSDWDRSRSISQYFLGVIERFFVLKRRPTPQSESFDNAVAKYNLDEKELAAKALGLKRLSYSLLVMAIFLLMYGLYQLMYGSMKGVLISLVEVSIALVLAFRYHFWYFQIEHRKLGCDLKEWFKVSFMGAKR